MNRSLIILTLMLFGALSGAALWYHGYLGILMPHFQSFGAGQVFADLVIALGLVMIWMWQDAQKMQRNPWPWLGITFGGRIFWAVAVFADAQAGVRGAGGYGCTRLNRGVIARRDAGLQGSRYRNPQSNAESPKALHLSVDSRLGCPAADKLPA